MNFRSCTWELSGCECWQWAALVIVIVISKLALKIQAERSGNIPARLILTAHLCRGIDQSRCLSLTPSLRVDVALFTRLTKRILYTGNACECKSPCSNAEKFIYFHTHSWFALCKATERGHAAESDSLLYIVAWDKVGTQGAGSSE